MQYFCEHKGRRLEVARVLDNKTAALGVNGIDYIEVTENYQTTIEVHFFHNLPGSVDNPVPPAPSPALSTQNCRIEGGVRIKNIRITEVTPSGKVLQVIVNEPGDFSKYTFRIVTSSTVLEPPPGFDPLLSVVDFSFKINCPSDFDCKIETKCIPEKPAEPRIDYLARDYASFRRLMLDRLSVIMPKWKERNPADLQVALVELLAWAGDHLSYYQDAVATEAYLGTARKRISLKRHSRLLDYFVHDGCNARTWVSFEISEGSSAENFSLPAGSVLTTKGVDNKTAAYLEEQDSSGVFETKHAITLHSTHNEIRLYTWGDSECCLPKGATCATLIDEPGLFLEKGDVLIFEEVLNTTSPVTGVPDTSRRHAVRITRVNRCVDQLYNIKVLEIKWHEEDRLPFPFCISKSVDGILHDNISIARGNIVLADHGISYGGEELIPAVALQDELFRPRINRTDITAAVPYDHQRAKSESASGTLMQNPHAAMPVVRLIHENEEWSVVQDLLGSDSYSPEFVVETEYDGTASLRFGDDALGKKPETGFYPKAYYRTGNGRKGNIGRDTICNIANKVDGILTVRNPVAAKGGTDPETMEEIREFAPQAFRTQKRAVTESDYSEKTQLHPEVQKAAARFRWTGSWCTVFLFIDRKGGKEVDQPFKTGICRFLEQYRMAGYDLEIAGPQFVPLDVSMNVCVKQGYFRSNVKLSLTEVFGKNYLSDGTPGFFHPDNFTFGQPLFLSNIIQRALEVSGVASVEIEKFQRWAKNPDNEKYKGLIKADLLEILRLDNDPNFPENGKIEFIMYGGL